MSDRYLPNRRQRAEQLLTQYECLQSEKQDLIDQQGRRIQGLMAAIAAVIGYALYAGHLVYLGMVPILIGLVFVEVILTHNQMLFVAKHLAVIEAALAGSSDSPFRHERVRGGVFGDERGRGGRLSLADVPHLFQLALGVVAYGCFAVISTRPVAWERYGGNVPSVAGIDLNAGLVGAALLAYFAGLLLVGISHLALRSRVHGDVAASVSPSKIAP
ncbi:hypothetical protein [Haloferax sp. KTX1]|uniref:hypothetical protein n=1 Tax=Haloferax sp. KTX1 TaxID=2600597 RepID=UPI0011DDA9C8|nr:hypothetical protein [Haloferax sp. KTX1]